MVDLKNYSRIFEELKSYNATLVAVSKQKSVEDIRELFNHGQRAFGENYVQELVEKQKAFSDPEWHFIGHLQTNKVKQVASFVSLVHGIDSEKVLREVDKQAKSAGRKIPCLLQVHIGMEETKFGFSFEEAERLLNDNFTRELKNVEVKGLMGMATLTDDENIIRNEFKSLNTFFVKFKGDSFNILSMGMTSDYKIALEEGSNMVRIGSAIFGERK